MSSSYPDSLPHTDSSDSKNKTIQQQPEKLYEKYKVVISDCHLSAGRFFEGRLNVHEDFNFDEEMCAMFEFFSSGIYGDGPHGPVDVELFINGDFLDFLNVPYNGEFEDT